MEFFCLHLDVGSLKTNQTAVVEVYEFYRTVKNTVHTFTTIKVTAVDLEKCLNASTNGRLITSRMPKEYILDRVSWLAIATVENVFAVHPSLVHIIINNDNNYYCTRLTRSIRVIIFNLFRLMLHSVATREHKPRSEMEFFESTRRIFWKKN